jgi:hypothetical protein
MTPCRSRCHTLKPPRDVESPAALLSALRLRCIWSGWRTVVVLFGLLAQD